MSPLPDTATSSTRSAISDCWNRIGVRGDSSCPQLEQHIHCRNCPVYSAGAVDLLDTDPPSDYLAFWTRQIAEEKTLAERDTHSVLVFRTGAEWLALPTAVLTQIASVRPIHTIPHRRGGVVLGLVNIAGELLVCFSLSQVMGVEHASTPKTPGHRAEGRFLVAQREGARAVFPADEVYGIQHFHQRDLAPVPATVARAAATYTQGVLPWQNKTVGLIDDQLLFHTLNRSLG